MTTKQNKHQQQTHKQKRSQTKRTPRAHILKTFLRKSDNNNTPKINQMTLAIVSPDTMTLVLLGTLHSTRSSLFIEQPNVMHYFCLAIRSLWVSKMLNFCLDIIFNSTPRDNNPLYLIHSSSLYELHPLLRFPVVTQTKWQTSVSGTLSPKRKDVVNGWHRSNWWCLFLFCFKCRVTMWSHSQYQSVLRRVFAGPAFCRTEMQILLRLSTRERLSSFSTDCDMVA